MGRRYRKEIDSSRKLLQLLSLSLSLSLCLSEHFDFGFFFRLFERGKKRREKYLERGRRREKWVINRGTRREGERYGKEQRDDGFTQRPHLPSHFDFIYLENSCVYLSVCRCVPLCEYVSVYATVHFFFFLKKVLKFYTLYRRERLNSFDGIDIEF